MSATRLRVDGLKLGFSNGRHALFAEHNACFVSDAIVCPLFSVWTGEKISGYVWTGPKLSLTFIGS